ncbi:thioredoxin-like protein [Chaetomium strumarium]|uniref:Glutathione S-transferase kappa n=1 Tax=Chaetomium strumarium TaxID=1170767 RepID=A0AAJ0GQW5_9PEZI|nr:thioredoxin-like protein [Chaetomium strumarium]
MARPKITLYVDTVSPFAYEAYYVLRHDPVFKNCDVTYVPIFLGGLMHKCGNTPPLKIKNKDKWINAERLRWAGYFSIPMTTGLPPDFPANTLPVMRALCAIAASDTQQAQQQQQPRLTRALDALFARHWVDAVATHKPEVLKQTLVGLFGEAETEKIQGRASYDGTSNYWMVANRRATAIVLAEASTTGKKALLENTDKAFAEGAFGLPWMVCTNTRGETEGFWGVDHLGQVVQFLGLRKDGNPWRALL